MFSFRKRFLYPVVVEQRDPAFGQVLLEHYGGKDSEFSAAAQYLNHRSNIQNRYVKELLGMIAAEEMSHMEMIGAAISKLGCTLGYVNSQGIPWNIGYVDQSLDPIMMMQADAEAERRARNLYNLHLQMTNDPGLKKMIKFLASREDVHEALFLKAQRLMMQNAPVDQYARLIYEYRMSLQVLE